MSVILETPYLLNIALYFKTEFDIIRFIQINKKCYFSVCMLKINPYFFLGYPTEWFARHFSPDTINRNKVVTDITQIDYDAKYIRYPAYQNFYDNIDLSKSSVLFSKITHLSFDNYDNHHS